MGIPRLKVEEWEIHWFFRQNNWTDCFFWFLQFFRNSIPDITVIIAFLSCSVSWNNISNDLKSIPMVKWRTLPTWSLFVGGAVQKRNWVRWLFSDKRYFFVSLYWIFTIVRYRFSYRLISTAFQSVWQSVLTAYSSSTADFPLPIVIFWVQDVP